MVSPPSRSSSLSLSLSPASSTSHVHPDSKPCCKHSIDATCTTQACSCIKGLTGRNGYCTNCNCSKCKNLPPASSSEMKNLIHESIQDFKQQFQKQLEEEKQNLITFFNQELNKRDETILILTAKLNQNENKRDETILNLEKEFEQLKQKQTSSSSATTSSEILRVNTSNSKQTYAAAATTSIMRLQPKATAPTQNLNLKSNPNLNLKSNQNLNLKSNQNLYLNLIPHQNQNQNENQKSKQKQTTTQTRPDNGQCIMIRGIQSTTNLITNQLEVKKLLVDELNIVKQDIFNKCELTWFGISQSATTNYQWHNNSSLVKVKFPSADLARQTLVAKRQYYETLKNKNIFLFECLHQQQVKLKQQERKNKFLFQQVKQMKQIINEFKQNQQHNNNNNNNNNNNSINNKHSSSSSNTFDILAHISSHDEEEKEEHEEKEETSRVQSSHK